MSGRSGPEEPGLLDTKKDGSRGVLNRGELYEARSEHEDVGSIYAMRARAVRDDGPVRVPLRVGTG